MSEKHCSVENCTSPVRTGGMCNKHYLRWMRHGDVHRGRPSRPLHERFWEKVNKTESCWLWTASLQNTGYGQINIGGDSPTMRNAHQLAWEWENGPTPKGMHLDHICHNKACVNPSHLRVTTVKQNLENRSGLNSNNTSGFRGVTWFAPRKKWAGRVYHNGQRVNVGYFDTAEEANEVVTAKRLELFTHNELDRKAVAQ
jgi:hypothetical protein